MNKRLLLTLLIILFALAGCGSEQYGAGVNPGAQKVSVKDVLLQQALIGQTVTLEGKISSQCQSNGCWFFLQDETGQIYIDLATNKFTLPSLPGKQVRASGTVVRSQQNILLVASGVEVK